jgi:hypothetical protein
VQFREWGIAALQGELIGKNAKFIQPSIIVQRCGDVIYLDKEFFYKT